MQLYKKRIRPKKMMKEVVILGISLIGLIGGIHYIMSEKEDSNEVVINVRGVRDVSADLNQRVQLFKEWMVKYKKIYGVGESTMRFAIWNEAYDFALEHNAKGLSWTCGVNQFSDLTKEEFSAMYLGYIDVPNRPRNVTHLDESDLSNTIDWRTKGAVTPIKNQGQCGSCYTFATSGALEALHFIKNKTLISFSEQQQVDCSSSYGNQGCQGGLMENSFKYTKDKGIMKESDYPYKAAVETCKYVASKVVFRNKDYTNVAKNNPNQLKAAINKQPVTVALEADQSAFQQYTGGIISSNCGTNLDHAILAVGYTSNYWIAKNQWGANWGEKGYVRIAIGTQNNGAGVCGINSDPSYPTAY